MLISGGQLILADTTPAFSRTMYFNRAGLDLSRLFATYAAIYRAQPSVATVVNKRAKGTARLPLKVYERMDNGRDEARDTPYAELLRRPNPKHDPHFMWLWTASTYDIYGEAMWYKLRGRDGKPAEVWPMHPTNVSVRNDGDDVTYVWNLGQSGVLAGLEIPSADVVHFKTYNPDTSLRGMSALEPLRWTLLNEDATRRASAAFWQNGARPSAYLSHPGKLSTEAIEHLRVQWTDQHGGVDNFAKTAILEEGMEPKILSLTAEESQYIESRKLNREEVCMVYDMPPPAVHILDHATYSNITEQMRSLYRDTMAPILGMYESVLDQQLRPDFDDGSLYAEFLMDEVMRGTLEERSIAIQAAINSAQMTPNEARALDNRPPMEGGDRLYVNAALIPIDEVSQHVSPVAPAMTPPETPQEEADQPAAGDADPGEKALTKSQCRAVMGRLGRVKSLGTLDPARLAHGLDGSVLIVVTRELATAQGAGSTVDEFKARLRAIALEA